MHIGKRHPGGVPFPDYEATQWPGPGYCLSRDEMTDGAASVAAPITGSSGEVVASVSVVVPSSTEKPLVPAVRLTAAAVGRALGPCLPLSGRMR
jgi:DNA-binding IclR family transcriptional regulator